MHGAVVAVPAGVLGIASLAAGFDMSALITIHVTTKTVQSTHVDLGKKGLSQGDQFVFADDMFMSGTKVGTNDGVCTVTRLRSGSADMQCVVTATLPKGQLTFQGPLRATGSRRTVRFAVTGGTGAYRDVGGYVSGRSTSGDTATATLVLQHLRG